MIMWAPNKLWSLSKKLGVATSGALILYTLRRACQQPQPWSRNVHQQGRWSFKSTHSVERERRRIRNVGVLVVHRHECGPVLGLIMDKHDATWGSLFGRFSNYSWLNAHCFLLPGDVHGKAKNDNPNYLNLIAKKTHKFVIKRKKNNSH